MVPQFTPHFTQLSYHKSSLSDDCFAHFYLFIFNASTLFKGDVGLPGEQGERGFKGDKVCWFTMCLCDTVKRIVSFPCFFSLHPLFSS